MKKIQKKIAFSLVELIIVIAIMTIIGTTSFFYFGDFLDKTTANNVIGNFSQEIKDLDNKIKLQNLFDYEINLQKNKNGYYFYENKYFSKKNLVLDNINYTNGNGSFKIDSGTDSGTFFYSIFVDDKLFKKDVAKGDKTISFDFKGKNEVFIKAFYDSDKTNNIKIKYFAYKKENTKRDKINLEKILCDSNKKNKLIIKNIGGKKEFLDETKASCLNPELIFKYYDKKLSLKLK